MRIAYGIRNGTLNRVHVSTLWAVLQPNAVFVEIDQIENSLLIEAELAPRDVAFVRSGEATSEKISTEDYPVCGASECEVVRIGPETVRRDDEGKVFRVVVRTARSFPGTP